MEAKMDQNRRQGSWGRKEGGQDRGPRVNGLTSPSVAVHPGEVTIVTVHGVLEENWNLYLPHVSEGIA